MTTDPAQLEYLLTGNDNRAETEEQLHARQVELWGWHDMRRKSEAQTSAPCRCNIKGRCDHKSCCCHWADDPNRFSNEEYSGE